MMNEQTKIHSAVRREQAERYILTSLIAFAITVIVTRAFLQLTGFPQIGNSVLHIAHALWGGLLLILAAYLPLAYANRWALQASAVLGGIGTGLFIDEVGKFITQANDYFFPPALPLIYGFILLNVLGYLFFRRPSKENPRRAMYIALEGLQDLLDEDFDATEASHIQAQLDIARQSELPEIISLANALGEYLVEREGQLPEAKPGLWKRVTRWIDAVGLRLGRRRHRAIISILLIGWVVFVVGYIALIFQGGANLDPQVLQWRVPLIVIQVVVGILMVVAAILWLIQREELALKFGISGFLISLVALQLLYFYISQFLAITMTLLQLAILLVLFTYRRWYFSSAD
jgi:hypothetical protein